MAATPPTGDTPSDNHRAKTTACAGMPDQRWQAGRDRPPAPPVLARGGHGGERGRPPDSARRRPTTSTSAALVRGPRGYRRPGRVIGSLDACVGEPLLQRHHRARPRDSRRTRPDRPAPASRTAPPMLSLTVRALLGGSRPKVPGRPRPTSMTRNGQRSASRCGQISYPAAGSPCWSWFMHVPLEATSMSRVQSSAMPMASMTARTTWRATAAAAQGSVCGGDG